MQDEETALLEQALAMSMVDDAEAGAPGGGDIPMADSMSEELALGTFVATECLGGYKYDSTTVSSFPPLYSYKPEGFRVWRKKRCVADRSSSNCF